MRVKTPVNKTTGSTDVTHNNPISSGVTLGWRDLKRSRGAGETAQLVELLALHQLSPKNQPTNKIIRADNKQDLAAGSKDMLFFKVHPWHQSMKADASILISESWCRSKAQPPERRGIPYCRGPAPLRHHNP